MSASATRDAARPRPGPAATTPPLDPSAAASAPNIALLELPPTDANIPPPPIGFVAPAGTDYRGVTPKRAELAVLPKALEELGRFTDYVAVFGKTAPPLASLQETLNAALQARRRARAGGVG
jgi:hypothetical protein